MHLHRCPQLSPRPLRQSLLKTISPQRHRGHKDRLLTEGNEANEGKIRFLPQWTNQTQTFVSFVTFCKKDFAFAKRCERVTPT